MNEDKIQRLEIDMAKVQAILKGEGMDGGLVNAAISLGNVVHGTKENPGGLVKRVDDQDEKIEKLMKVFYMGMGAWWIATGVTTIAWMVFTHFHK